jgi:Lrp/AsnC family transcriptional regulator, leucine-responsive regulatory protein
MIDEFDRRIIEELVKDARTSLKDLATKVELSSPSTAERLRRLQERGIIHAFTLEVNLQTLGYTLEAIVRIKPLPGKLHEVQKLIQGISQFTECDKVTGEDCFFARLQLRSITQLDQILEKITQKAETSTSIVKSQPIKRRLPPLTKSSMPSPND